MLLHKRVTAPPNITALHCMLMAVQIANMPTYPLPHLAYRHDDGHVGRLGVCDGLRGLRPNAVVGSDDNDRHVSDTCSPRTHGAEGL